MIYIDFQVDNFKGIKSLHLDLSGQPKGTVFCLVGLNESGKTTILEALHWFYDSSNYEPTDLIPKGELLNFNERVSVTANLSLDQEDEDLLRQLMKKHSSFSLESKIQTFSVTKWIQYRNSVVESEGSIWDFEVLGKTKKMKTLRAYSHPGDPYWEAAKSFLRDKIQAPIIYYENFLFDFPDHIYLETKPGAQVPSGQTFYKAVVQDVLNSMQKELTVEKHIVQRFRGGDPSELGALESVLDKLASAIETKVFAAWKQLLHVEGNGLSITFGNSLHEDEVGYFLQVKIKEGDQSYFIRERSLGFRWFFSFVLFTHFRAYRGHSFRNAMFLLDEPASNLHPSAQSQILQAFMSFPNDQTVLYSTHSHHMINPDWLAGTFVVKNKAKEYRDFDISYNSFQTDITADSYYHFVSQYPNDTDFFRPILDALDYAPSKLEFVPNLVIVEGKNDYYTLNLISPPDTRTFSVYPSVGKDKTEYVVALYLAWGRRFILLLDDDKGGNQTKKRLLKNYGEILKGRVFTLADIVEDWAGFEMENLFSDNDLLSLTRQIIASANTWQKAAVNASIQRAVISSSTIKFDATTRSRFRRVVEFSQQRLNAQTS